VSTAAVLGRSRSIIAAMKRRDSVTVAATCGPAAARHPTVSPAAAYGATAHPTR
jgi:hypothetical protein